MEKILAAVFGVGIIIAILFFATSNRVGLNPEFDRSGTPMKITVYTYKNKYALNKLHPDGELPREGWSLWYQNDSSECEIHVLEGKSIDDDTTMTWGHELQHCIYGRFHK